MRPVANRIRRPDTFTYRGESGQHLGGVSKLLKRRAWNAVEADS